MRCLHKVTSQNPYIQTGRRPRSSVRKVTALEPKWSRHAIFMTCVQKTKHWNIWECHSMASYIISNTSQPQQCVHEEYLVRARHSRNHRCKCQDRKRPLYNQNTNSFILLSVRSQTLEHTVRLSFLVFFAAEAPRKQKWEHVAPPVLYLISAPVNT